jgi:membrane-associated phospholipid phosphatase
MLTAIICAKNSLKFIYQANRPFWEDVNLTAGETHCSLDFGKPSGHSSESGAMATFLYLEFLYYLR